MKNAKIKKRGEIRFLVNGKFHREKGPAVEYSDGEKEWWIHGVQYTEEEFNQLLEKKNLHEKLQSNFEPKYKEKKIKI